ncbi:MAG: 23S rRNA (adenine(2503)-C(2))-methyltransferase RlmN, partial [Clostridia bacterium]|nr:23S rRNA (adenine(2503)-C(2))-methyltransferase RlmN [Clostridia bacterium]
GLVPEIYRLADEGLPVNLTISLHSPADEWRARSMTSAKKYSIDEILKACAYYFEKTGRRYIFEYSLISGENCESEHAERLIKLLKGKPCHVNLIRLNEVEERSLKTVTDKQAYRFLGLLEKGGLSATVRRSMGNDIGGACGQLRANHLKEN